MHGRPKFYFECSIIDGSSNLLSGGTSLWAQKKAQERLLGFGVKFILGKKIKEVKKKKIILENDSVVEFDLLVWTGGVKKNTISQNQLFADAYLRISPHKNVFGVGDSIYFVNEKTGAPLPMTASMAIRQAKYVSENIKRVIQKRNLKEYKPKFPGFVIPIGGKYAIFEKGFLNFSGFLPWVLKNLVALHYFKTLFGWGRAFKILRQELKIFVRND